MSSTVRLTMAQALVRFLAAQHTERDGIRQPFFGGVFGIFGHGNVAGVAQALDQMSDRLRYYVGSSRVDLQACKLEYSIVSPK